MSGMQSGSANTKAMIVGIALVAAGGLISVCGMGISGTAMYSSARRWLTAQQEPPTAVVKRKVAQAKAATQAGASAWQNGMATSARPQ
jgi:hypothetical protein